MPRPRFVATWKFGQPVADKALQVARSGHSMLDAIEHGIWVAENDEDNPTVGFGGTPNAEGRVELDACIMNGPDHGAGAVGGLQEILHPISIARKVMTETPHVMLVGAGAQQFALEQGFRKTDLLTQKEKQRFAEWRAKHRPAAAPHADGKSGAPECDEEHHDTITLLGIDADANLYGGCSTSGWGYKIPGRVGDSPIIGAGLYVDNEFGAAGATGTGENVMRYCASFWIVQMMAQGLSPTEACAHVVREIARKDPLPMDKLSINFIAVNKAGEFGGAGTSEGFLYATAEAGSSRMHQPLLVKPL